MSLFVGSRSFSAYRMWILTLAACFLCLTTAVQAQINTGRVTGTVRDATGAVVPEVRILATNDATGAVTAAQSSADGNYVSNFLIPGTYHLAAERPGFQREVAADVVVNAGGITRIDFSLAVGQVQQAVEVTANPLTVATETSE